MKAYRLLVLPLILTALVSCAKDKPKSSSPMTLNQRLNEKSGFLQDSEGKWAPRVNRRSSFETKGESPYFKGEYAKKQYQVGEFAKKSWQGNKSVENKAYQGNTDGSRFMKNSRFANQSARETSKGARESGQSANEGGQSYATNDAREANAKAIAKPTDAATDNRRNSYPRPEIIDWQQQRALNVEQTKRILGRQ